MTPIKQISRKQKVIGLKGIITLITIVNMIIPLSTDLYLPAMPSMTHTFNTSATLINMTLTLFFLFLGLGTLFCGPLSDKYGRKPVLLAGNLLYILSSFACAGSGNIYLLIIFRIFQAIGAGACIAVTMAIVKDCFYGKLRDKILALIQTVSVLAPIVAPVLGAFVLKYTTWNMLFIILAIFAIIFFILSVLYTETLTENNRTKENILNSVGRLIVVCKNIKFTYLLIIFSLLAAPFMGYLTIASYIYIDMFGLSKQGFSYYFAINALFSVLGPIIYVNLLNKISSKNFAIVSFITVLFFALLLFFTGYRSAFIFFLLFIPIAIGFSSTRPLCASVLFKQQKQDSGSVSSLISSGNTLFGCFGMFLVSIPVLSLTQRLAAVSAISSLLSIILFLLLLKKYQNIPGIK